MSPPFPFFLFRCLGLGDADGWVWRRLLFMTYNGWVMAAVGVGAFVGYLVFGNSTSATKDSACH